MIHVRQLTKHYDDGRRGRHTALGGISFDAMPGQVFGLLGANGAGKTTTLRILATLLKPSGGEVRINGMDLVEQPRQVRQQIGFVSVNTATYDRMTAGEMVQFFGRLHGLSPDQVQRRAEWLFSRFQMESLRDALGASMSTGMRQKVSLVRALVHDPPVLIFDEATTGLDVFAAREVLRTISRLRDEGKCIVLSTHNMHEAQQLCDHVAILHCGRILAQGSLRPLSQRYGTNSLEELFFNLVSAPGDSTPAPAQIERTSALACGGIDSGPSSTT